MSDDPIRPIPSQQPPTVFICRDHALDDVLDGIAIALRSRGTQVLRGPASHPGTLLDYPHDGLQELFGNVDAAIFSSRSRCTRAVMMAAPRLRAIVNPTIGLETIDLEAANDLGIIVGHGAFPENFESMAEASVMLMLNLLYNLRASEDVLAGRRPKPAPGAEHAMARMMKHSTIGLLGLGRIGRAVAHRLHPFGARLLAYSPSLTAETAPQGVLPVGLDELLVSSDIVGVFVAITDGSRRILDRAALAKLKPGAFIVNVARGAAIDEQALVEVLQERRIAGAALDTFEVEPLPAHSPLRSLSNVILTPHMVGHTREAYEAIPRTALQNILNVLAGEPPVHCKNPEILQRWHGRLSAIAARDASD